MPAPAPEAPAPPPATRTTEGEQQPHAQQNGAAETQVPKRDTQISLFSVLHDGAGRGGSHGVNVDLHAQLGSLELGEEQTGTF